MRTFAKKVSRSMTLNMIGAVILLLAFFGVIVSTLGYVSFTDAIKREYSTSTYHMAETAALLISGDDIDDYLAGEKEEDYLRTKDRLDEYCRTMAVSIIYVIDVERKNYGRFVSVFNSVNNSVGNTKYQPWPLGYKRDTTNDEYRDKYEAIYNGERPYETVYRMDKGGDTIPHITTMVPVKDTSGQVVAILCVQRPAKELIDARRPYLYTVAASAFALAVLFAVFAGLYLRKEFVIPIRKISDEADRFAKESTKGTGLGSVSNINEISSLAKSVDMMESDMVRYIENLTGATAEKERISTELSLAAGIQNNSIPNVFPAFPDRKDFDIYASMNPAKEVAGDFYNFFLTDDDHLAVVIGDVSGKGIPSALFMMVTNILISDRTKMGGTPAGILTYVNQNICAHNTAEMFTTVWLGILELSTGKLTAVNAGHEDAAVYRKDGSFEYFKTKHDFVAGGLRNTLYNDFEIVLEKGDKLFLYTDGVTEAVDTENDLYGYERLLQTLNDNHEKDPKGILDSVRKSVLEFASGAPQSDDLTMLCLERK